MTSSTAFDPNLNENLIKLFEPESIAIVGASASPWKWGFRFIHNITNGGFTGKVYGVNPQHDEILGTPIVHTIADLPEPIDLAYIIVPPPGVPKALRECAAKGIKAVVIITAGFGELEDEDTKAAQQEIATIAREEGIAVVGPNCAGLVSPEPYNLFGAMFTWEAAKGGGLSIVSQSGNVAATILRWSMLHQVGISRIVSSGNEAVSTTEDFLCFYADDPRTEVIFAYIEGVPDGRRLFDALKYATAKKPVVVMKGGRNAAGVRATESHTGSLATSMELFRAACRQAGASLVDDIFEAAELCGAYINQPLPKGRNTVIITQGGGWGVMAADACADAGLNVVDLPEETIAELDTFLPGWWSRGNPVDLVAGVQDPRGSVRVAEIVLKSSAVDAIIFLGVGFGGPRRSQSKQTKAAAEKMGGPDADKMADSFRKMGSRNNARLVELKNEIGKPIMPASEAILSAYGETPNPSVQELEAQGLSVACNVVTSARTLARLADRYEFLNGTPRQFDVGA